MSSAEKSVIWNDSLDNREKYFVGSANIFWNETTTTLITSVLNLHPVHVMLLHFFDQLGWWLILNGLTPIGFVFVGCNSRQLEEKLERAVVPSCQATSFRLL